MRALLLCLLAVLASPATASASDSFAGATNLGTFTAVTQSGSSAAATNEADEPEHLAGETGTSSMWYRWQAPITRPAVVDLEGTEYDSIVAVYVANDPSSPAIDDLTRIGALDNPIGGAEHLNFNAAPGTVYYVVVEGWDAPARGAFTLRISQEAPHGDDFADARTIEDYAGLNLATATSEDGEPDALPGSSSNRSVWFTFTAPRDGGIEVDTCHAPRFDSFLGVFTGTAVGALTLLAGNDDDFDACPDGGSFLGLRATKDVPYRIKVDVFDAAGPAPDQFTVLHVAYDDTPPDTAIEGGPPAATRETTAAGFVLKATRDQAKDPRNDLDRFECALDGAAFGACPGSFSGLADGEHTLRARAVDVAGNADPSPAERRWRVDTTPPDTRIVSGPSGVVADPTAVFGFDAEAGATYTCSLDGGAAGPCTSPIAYANLADGPHSFSVAATDSVGNRDASPAAASFTVKRPPVLIDTKLVANFLARARSSKMTRYRLERVPAGAVVTASCKRGCPFKTKSATARKAGVFDVMKAFFPRAKRKLRKGTVIEVQVTRAGNFTGNVFVTRVRGSNGPLSTKRCLPPGVARPVKC